MSKIRTRDFIHFIYREVSAVNSYRKDALTMHYCPEGQFNDLASIMFTSNEHSIYNLLTVNDANRCVAIESGQCLFVHN